MSPFRDPPAEIINAWELWAGLKDEIILGRKSLKSGPLTTHSLMGIDSRSPMKLWASIKGRPSVKRSKSLRFLSGPELLAEFEREVSEEEEEIKKMILENESPKKSKALRKSEAFLESYKWNVKVLERDIYVDSGFKEELRVLVGSKEVRVPLVFVRGRLIGGLDEVARLEGEGEWGVLLRGIPRAVTTGCKGCAGVRFMMCYECSGSCKMLGDDGRKSVKCGKCNENGLINLLFLGCCLFVFVCVSNKKLIIIKQLH
ncbi:Glutaredoxin family protein [Striga hermonthica]|uniref:Glutaredoxin family protein n=1 Tax=Striga hermonthica TaxID=68872 RepID=A0A9N7RQC7_STRHE|nr:Glutaredoxin family protein [Striga hermonthica]